MPLQMAIKQQDGSVAEHVLFEGRDYSVGRSPNSDIIVNHPQVSRSHARLNTDSENS
ncbi:FHA domain-containing protein [Alteromonas hispanica]|uniref:FHA domain-containing protein n=1 Tax=Alteromonas hispanica TaxID=315421 RepID=UPI001EF24A7E|nr:FHA domain-containing protein [Alteromonas hispanica]